MKIRHTENRSCELATRNPQLATCHPQSVKYLLKKRMVLDYNEGVGADAIIAGRQKAVPARGSQIVGAAFSRDKDHENSPPKLGGYEH